MLSRQWRLLTWGEKCLSPYFTQEWAFWTNFFAEHLCQLVEEEWATHRSGKHAKKMTFSKNFFKGPPWIRNSRNVLPLKWVFRRKKSHFWACFALLWAILWLLTLLQSVDIDILQKKTPIPAWNKRSNIFNPLICSRDCLHCSMTKLKQHNTEICWNYIEKLWQIHVRTLTNPCSNFEKSMEQLREIRVSILTNTCNKEEKSIGKFLQIHLEISLRENHVTTLTNPIWTKFNLRAEWRSDKARQISDLGPIKINKLQGIIIKNRWMRSM